MHMHLCTRMAPYEALNREIHVLHRKDKTLMLQTLTLVPKHSSASIWTIVHIQALSVFAQNTCQYNFSQVADRS